MSANLQSLRYSVAIDVAFCHVATGTTVSIYNTSRADIGDSTQWAMIRRGWTVRNETTGLAGGPGAWKTWETREEAQAWIDADQREAAERLSAAPALPLFSTEELAVVRGALQQFADNTEEEVAAEEEEAGAPGAASAELVTARALLARLDDAEGHSRPSWWR